MTTKKIHRHRVARFLFPSLPRDERRRRMNLIYLTLGIGLGFSVLVGYFLWESRR